MEKHPPEFVQASEQIGEFINAYSLDYVAFERLKSQTTFSSLNERRLRDWAPLPGIPLPDAKPQRRTQRMLAALAEWIQQDPLGLLRALGATDKARLQAPNRRRRASTSDAPPFGISDNPDELIPSAIRLAGLAYQRPAVDLLLHAIARRKRRDLHQAMQFLPATIYVIYRFCSPTERARSFKALHSLLPSRGLQEDQLLHDLSLAQLACAFNERTVGDVAANLFLHRPEVRRLLESPFDIRWPQQQLMRSVSVYFAVSARDPDEAISWANQAAKLDPDIRNQRSVAVSQTTAYLYMPDPDFKRAWAAIEPHYWNSRDILINAASGTSAQATDLLHLYADHFVGTITRCLCGKGYLNRSELADDLHALNWCQEECGLIERDDGLDDAHRHRLPPPLAELQKRTLKSPLAPGERTALYDLRKLLLGEN